MITVMITLFTIVIVGYGAGKLGYLGGDFDRQLSFEIAAQMAYKSVCAQAKAVLEEVKGRADLV